MIGAYWLIVFIILLLIVLSAFFSGSETALTAASRARMHQLEKRGNKRAGLVMKLLEKRDKLIGTLLIGNNIVNILASALATSFFLKLFGAAGVAVATIVMTILVVIFAEVMPKSWALSRPDKFSLAVAPTISILVKLFSPLTRMTNWIVRNFLRLFGMNISEGDSLLSAHEEIRGAVEVLHRDASLVKDDRDRLGGILDLHELEISDVMVHRTNMKSINVKDPSEQIVKQMLDSAFTRIPLWEGKNDNIVGILHSKDVLRALSKNKYKAEKLDILKIASKPWFVPETTTLKDQLDAFLKKQTHFAVVVDEYGEMEGMVTLEDILEEIVGDIADEHDSDVSGVSQEADGSWIVDGDVQLRDLNRALDWDLPDDEANTIAGLVIHSAQMIPEEKQAFTFFNKRFVILSREKNRVTQLRIRDL